MTTIRGNWEKRSIALMLDLGADPSIPDRAGRLPLDSAQNQAIRQLLLDHAEKAKIPPGISPSLRARLRSRQPVPSL